MQRKGIGQEMMRFSEKRALELRFDSIKLFVDWKNIGSIKFHEKLGYVHTGYMKECLAFIKLLEVPNTGKMPARDDRRHLPDMKDTMVNEKEGNIKIENSWQNGGRIQ